MQDPSGAVPNLRSVEEKTLIRDFRRLADQMCRCRDRGCANALDDKVDA